MQIKSLMSEPVITVHPTDTLNTAARLMWDHDTGMLPVVDDDGRLIGAMTDRDICMCAYINGTLLDALTVSRSMSKEIHSCSPDDDIAAVEAKMVEFKVRRLPVVDSDGHPIGVVSVNDLARNAMAKSGNGSEKMRAMAFARVMAAIGEPRLKPLPSKKKKKAPAKKAPAKKKPQARA